MSADSIINPLIGPLVTTVLGAGGLWFQEWRQGRDQSFQRKQMRTEAEETIEFFEKWVKAQESLCSPEEFEQVKTHARAELDKAYQRLVEMHDTRTHFQAYTLFQRAFLWYKPTRLLSWFTHSLFYLLFAVFIFLSIAFVTPADPGEPATPLWQIILADVIIFIPVFLARAWAVAVDNRHPVAPPPSTIAVAPAPAPAPVPAAPLHAQNS